MEKYRQRTEVIPEKPAVDVDARDNSNQKGREIRGLEPKEEKFSVLEENKDYVLSEVNSAIVSEYDPREFVVFVNPSNGNKSMTIVPPHWRTISAPFEGYFAKDDGEKEPFFTANTKGVGYLKPTVKGGSIEEYDNWTRYGFIEGERILGVYRAKPGGRSPENCTKLSNHLINAGLRTEAYWSMADLKRIPYKGEMRTLKELNDLGVFPRKSAETNTLIKPAEIVRLLKTNTRIEEAFLADERREQIFADAFDIYNREASINGEEELSIGNRQQEQEFFAEFSKRMGKNIAVLLNEGYSHGFLHSANITMAAEVVDLEPMQYWSKDTKAGGWKDVYDGLRLQHIKDMRDVVYGLRRLFNAAKEAGLSTGTREDLARDFLDSFESNLSDDAVNHEIDLEAAKTWMKKITDHVIVKRLNLPSLQSNDISDWDI